ncbi:MAG: hypothetical protein K0Q49_392 [Haloplasmataceae bacterium]|jgi:hypothetical protein|nr:hypothetical protein [Haloplasmataceae bacterium]
MANMIVNPDGYHGKNKKVNFFEGWYYKIVDKENKNIFAFIPGIIKDNKYEDGHAFIQILNGKNKKSKYIKFPINDFYAENKKFNIAIGKNYFNLNEIKLNHYDKDIQIIGTLRFVDILKWPDTFLNPGSMGFYNYLTFMECYSQVCCLDGGIVGKLLIDNEEIDFTGGKVYIEKNWGKKFPEAYIWIQSNSFNNQNIAFSCSIGKIPMYLHSFTGFLAGLSIDEQVYKFTTINKSNMKLNFKDNKIILQFTKNNLELNVETLNNDSEFLICKGPNKGKMNMEVKESLDSRVKIELNDLYKERVIIDCLGQATGVEIMGNLSELVRKIK